MHGEVLTLAMNQEALNSYVANSVGSSSLAKVHDGAFLSPTVASAIQGVLVDANKRSSTSSSNFRLRLARQSDIGTISRLIQALADYVKEPDAVQLTPEDYNEDGFCADPLFYSLIVDHVGDDGSNYACGYAICFFGHEIGKGRFLYLEDLFLEVEYRQGGGGSLVMSTLAQICRSLQCSQLYWQALDWNTAGLKFYEKIGATILEGVKTSRYCGEAMIGFAEDNSG
jgi:GNAT superfamily N-acetyltransferase